MGGGKFLQLFSGNLALQGREREKKGLTDEVFE
jgi:hypothetical protein